MPTQSRQGETTQTRRGVVGWPAVALLAVAFFVAMLSTTLPTPLYATYAAELGFGELVTTVVFAAYAVGVATALFALGHWSDQVGRRPMLLAGLVLSGCSAVAFLLPTALGWLFVGRVLSGFSAGIFAGTATAAVVDVAPRGRGARAGLVAAAVNMGGLGSGPLLAGVLVQLAPSPTRLPYVVDLVLVAIGIGCVLAVRESVARADSPCLGPRRLGVPAEVRATFVRAAIAGFAGFAVLGLFTAVSPAFLGQVLHHENTALLGAVVAAVFAASVVGQLMSTPLGLDRALPVGCGLLILGMALVAVSLPAASLTLLVVGAVVAGLGQGTSFRAGLGAVVSGSPDELRGQVTSTYFITLYVGISLPVIGEGALASGVGLVTAGVVFSVLVAVLAAVALGLLLAADRGRRG